MRAVIINWFDKAYEVELTSSDWVSAIADGSTERGSANMLEKDEVHEIVVTVPALASITTYDEFTIQVIPPTGATVTLKRTTPGALDKVMDLY